MKRLLTISMILMLVAGAGCNREQPISQLEVGRAKLLGAGMEIEAVEHLKRAETEEAKNEVQKVEPRALLLIAYTHALEKGDAQTQGLAENYKNERQRRLVAMSEVEMKHILNVLHERHRVQNSAMQVLIDRGSDAVPLLIRSLGRMKYIKIKGELIDILYQIGSRGLDQMIAALKQPDISSAVKSTLARLIGRIDDKRAIPELESMRNSSEPGLRMEINIALYKLGEKEYQSEIIAGLKDSNVAVRRAASKAMPEINDSPADEIIKALEDTDAQVRMYAADALQKFPAAKAIDPLINIIKIDSDAEAKQAATRALIAHAEKGLGKNLAPRLIDELRSGQIHEPNDRLRIVQILKTDKLKKQIKTAPEEDNIEYSLWEYFQKKEENDMVKEELNLLLNELDRI